VAVSFAGESQCFEPLPCAFLRSLSDSLEIHGRSSQNRVNCAVGRQYCVVQFGIIFLENQLKFLLLQTYQGRH
jgi:hypothetical protein